MIRGLFGLMAAVVLMAPASRAAEENWVQRLLRVTGLTAAPGKLRGTDYPALAGAVWVVGIDGTDASRLTADSDFRSPVFAPDGRTVYVLRDDMLMSVPARGGEAVAELAVPGALKIVGFDRDNADSLVLLMDSDTAPIAVLSLKSRSPIRLAYDESLDGAADMLAQVRGEDRQYGSLGLLVREKSRRSGTGTVEWTEIYVQPGAGAPRLLTACDGDRCGQPALSPDAGRVAFVRKAAASPR